MTMLASRSRCHFVALLARSGLLSALAWPVVALGIASAQSRPAAEGFSAAVPAQDSYLSVWGTSTLRPGTYSVGLFGSYARRPLTVSSGDVSAGYLTGSVSTGELLGTVGILRPLDLSVAIPMHVLTRGGGFEPNTVDEVAPLALTDTKIRLGDIRVIPRLRLLEPHEGAQYGLALIVPVFLPTGDRDVYAGEKLRVEPKLAFEALTHDLTFGVNVGYLFRRRTHLLDVTIDDMATWGLAFGIRLTDAFRVLVEASGRLNIKASDFGSKDAPTELLGALRFTKGRFLAQLGAGPGLLGGITEPTVRILGAVAWLPAPPPPPDKDHDGILDSVDHCVNEPEDKDGFQDDDGCPDPDNDQDGVPDSADRCPNEPEDQDGFEDQDGCPEPDNDQDGIADKEDACPNLAGATSTTPAANGCPDRDVDGVPDGVDACPDIAGVASPDPARNGCPLDRDSDGILDASDACPEAPGPANPDPKLNGCPKARVEAGQIKITERIEFVSGKAELVRSSTSILEAVLQVMEAHPEIGRLSIEGHTDDKGDEKFNEGLSKRRAESVKRWLVAHGIDAARLDAQGFGESRPLVSNDTPEGRTTNRRVEFHIRSGPNAEVLAPAPASKGTLPPAP